MRKQTRKRKATQQFKERSMKCPVNVKIHPTSLEIRGVQVKSTVTYTHATRTAVMQVWQYQSYKGYEWQQLLKNAGGSVDWNNHFGRKLGNIQGASLVAQTVKNMPAVQETWVWSLGWEDPLEKGMATHSSILAWRIPWTEMGSQRVRHDWATVTFFHHDYKIENLQRKARG